VLTTASQPFQLFCVPGPMYQQAFIRRMEILNMHMALMKPLMPGINREGENLCKQYPYCLCWA
jgi:hypothetical protein